MLVVCFVFDIMRLRDAVAYDALLDILRLRPAVAYNVAICVSQVDSYI